MSGVGTVGAIAFNLCARQENTVQPLYSRCMRLEAS